MLLFTDQVIQTIATVFRSILESLTKLDFPVVFSLHPRTGVQIQKLKFSHYLDSKSIIVLPPVSYLDMLTLLSACCCVVTDSGGIQKEAYILGVPALLYKGETEWKETANVGWNQLVQPENLSGAIANFTQRALRNPLYGTGDAATKIADIIASGCIKTVIYTRAWGICLLHHDKTQDDRRRDRAGNGFLFEQFLPHNCRPNHLYAPGASNH